MAIPTIIAQQTLKQLKGYMNLAKTVAKDTDFENSFTVGDKLSINKPGVLTASQKTPGSEIVTQNATATKVDVSLDQHWYVSFTQEDITKALQKPDLQADYANSAAIALSEKIEGSLLALHPSITNSVKFDATSDTTVDASLRLIRSRFSRNKIPQQETKYLYLDTSVIDVILGVSRYTAVQNIGDGNAIIEGAVRRLYGLNIFESQLVPLTGSPGAYHNLAYTRNGLIIVSRRLALDGNGRGVQQSYFEDAESGITMRLTESYDDKLLGVKMTMDVLYGVAICDTRKIIEVESF